MGFGEFQVPVASITAPELDLLQRYANYLGGYTA